MPQTKEQVLQKYLIDFGLTDKEADTYLSLLGVQSATAQEIAQQTNINRSSTYVILEALKTHGLVSVSSDKKVKKYVATDPELLIKNIDDRLRKHEMIRSELIKILPELKALNKDLKQKPRVRVFEGREGLIAAFEDSLVCGEKIIRISSSVQNLFKILPDYFPKYLENRIKRGIRMRSMHPNDAIAQKLKNMTGIQDEPILIPEEKYPFPADIAIYDQTIGYMSPENGGLAILIESKEISEVMKSVFDMAWQEAKRLSIESRKKAQKNRQRQRQRGKND